MFDTKLRNKRCIAAAGLLWLLCHAGGAFALGFGEIRVNSALNEPLDATLTLVSLSEAEKSSLSVGVAGPDMFKRFGIERTSLDDELRVNTAQTSGSNDVKVRLTTRRPVREPFLRFLIEANTSEGRALREYTVLLDPPTQSPTVAATPAPTRSAPRPTAPASPAPPRPATAPRTAAARAPSATVADTYGPVGRGETLFSVATHTRRPGTTQDQMQVAIFRDNPQAFAGNMNVLLRGAMLSIPPVERITAIGESEARAQIAQNRRSATTPSTRAANTAQSTDKTTAADATQPPAMTRARLRLEPPRLASDTSRAGNGAFFGRLVEPDFSATTAPSSSPISTAQAADSVPSTQSSTAAGAAPQTAETEPAPPADAAMGEGAATAGNAMTQSTDALSTAAEPSAVATTQDATAAAAAPAAGVGDDDDAALPISAGERDVVSRSGGGLFRPLNLLLLLAVAGLLLLLLLWNRRRQYKPVQLDFDTEETAADDMLQTPAEAAPPLQDNEVATPGVAAGPVPAAVAGVAPLVRVQDADRQMKLGLFDDARTMLENGLAQTPTDAGLQDKLLERDYLAGDAQAFEQNVTRFDAQLAGNGVRWAGVAAMGRILLPHDPRFVPAGRMATSSQASASPDDATVARPSAANVASTPTSAAAPDDLLRGDLESIMEEPAKPAAQDFFADDTVVTPASVTDDDQTDVPTDDDVLSLDTGANEDGEYNWQPQEIGSAGERQHDRGDEPGMAFELDTSEFPDDSERPPIEPEQPKSQAFAPIDTSEFDLGDESSDDDGDFGAAESEADAVDIRIDLARMYLDMEDQQAARELLEEALGDGNETQRRTARELLDGL